MQTPLWIHFSITMWALIAQSMLPLAQRPLNPEWLWCPSQNCLPFLFSRITAAWCTPQQPGTREDSILIPSSSFLVWVHLSIPLNQSFSQQWNYPTFFQILFKCELRSMHASSVFQRGELSGNTSQVNSERFKMNKWWKDKCVSGSLETQAPDGLCLMMCSGHSAQVFPSRRCNQTLSMSMTTAQWQQNQDLLIRRAMAQHGCTWLDSDYCEILLDVHRLLRLLSISRHRHSNVSNVNIWGWTQTWLSSNYLLE